MLSAEEGGHTVAALLVDPSRLRSEVAWAAIARLRERGAEYVALKPAEMERISARDNPVGIVAVVRWRPRALSELAVPAGDALVLVCDEIHDPGNLGTLVRTADAAGAAGVVVCGGTDPAHPTALRSSLGTMFRLPIHAAALLDDVFTWSQAQGLATVATSAKADGQLWETVLPRRLAVLVGSEAMGLPREAVERCDVRLRIPMFGTATSLNVSVAAGIVLYEALRQRRAR